MVTIYGIRNCDTMKKTFAWLDAHGIDYRFHDYKKEGIARTQLTAWCQQAGWRALVNTRGTTWRKLSAEQQAVATQTGAIALMMEQPSLIKRPVLERGAQLLVGFDPVAYAKAVK